jgi:hypothetical protein
VKYHDFTMVTRAVTIPSATDDGGAIYRTVLPLLQKTEAGRRPVRLLGISLSQLESEAEKQVRWGQMPLFRGKEPVAEGTIERSRSLNSTRRWTGSGRNSERRGSGPGRSLRTIERWIPWPFGDRTFCFRRSCSISS